MNNLKLKWATGKMKWYTVDIKNSCFSTILSVIIGRDKYIYRDISIKYIYRDRDISIKYIYRDKYIMTSRQLYPDS